MNYLYSKDVEELFKTLLQLKTVGECRNYLRDLLTEAEIKEFANRWKVARLLEEKVPYEDITKKTGMSSTTIARIQKWLQNGKGGYRLMLKKINGKKRENKKSK
ncbi:MAG TPA: YerC/YecD family TrpR-related protein [Patescibacteria group bacterium]